MEQPPERHIECSECKKPVAYCYTEVVGKMIYRLGMCHDCPLLRQRLQGQPNPFIENTPIPATGLCCGGCGLTQDEVTMGAPLGCSLCYEVFEDLLIQELVEAGRIPLKIAVKKNLPLHMGRLPGQSVEVNPALKLLALNQALHETLSHEEYEQAAWLRDQIKELTKEESDGKKST